MFTWIKEKHCLLQETHSTDETCDVWRRQWGNLAFFSGTKSNSEGIGILINSKFSCDI